MIDSEGRDVDRSACAVDFDAPVQWLEVQDRRIGAALGRLERIAEPFQQGAARRFVGPDGQAGAHVEHDHA